jgi:hypothetical protein
MTDGLDPAPPYVIHGLRARPVSEWLQQLWAPALIFALIALTGPGSSAVWSMIIQASAAAALAIAFVVRIARGRIELDEAHLQITAWPDRVRSLAAAIPITAIHKVARVGTTLRIGFVEESEPRHVKLVLHEAIAEELFDRLLERVEATIPPQRITHHGPHRFVVSTAS